MEDVHIWQDNIPTTYGKTEHYKNILNTSGENIKCNARKWLSTKYL